MFSIYKISTFAIVAAISASTLMSVTSVANAADARAASEPIVMAADSISRTDARRLVRDQLKEDGKRGLRIGSTTRDKGFWVVTVTTVHGTPAYKVLVNAVSGELSRA